MDRTELAKAYRNIGVAYLQAAEVLEGSTVVGDDEPRADAPLQPLPPMADGQTFSTAYAPNLPSQQQQPAPVNMADPQRCPAHGYPYKQGARGNLFCSGKGSEPAWTDRKGYCSITPQNAAQYVAIHSTRP